MGGGVSIVLPVMYHWAPESRRRNINKRGLLPRTPSALLAYDSGLARGASAIGDVEWATFRTVCLGTSPSHAWSLSGAVFAEPGEAWDLWQVVLGEDDEVHPRPFHGCRLDEVRVANRIPKSRLWLVGSRTVAQVGRWRIAA